MKTKLISIGILLLAIVLLIVTLITVKIKTVKGDEIAVKETWSQGVLNETFGPQTYFLLPGFTQTLYPYKISQQVYVMNDDESDASDGRAKDSYLVQSAEGQDMRLSLAVQWRRDPLKIVELHKTVGFIPDGVEEKILRPELMRIVKDHATTMTALDAYSGTGLVKLQTDILIALRDEDGELRKRGIIVDNFVIQHIALDPKYVEQIKDKQVAIQERLKNMEQTKAALAAADKAKADAQADYETQVVMAKRDQAVGVLLAEKQAKQQVLAAQAAKEQVVLAAEGESEAGKLRGQGILAIGQAESDVIKLKMLAYAGSGADNFVKMEVAKSLAGGLVNIKGWLPNNVNYNTIGRDFSGAVNALMGNPSSVGATQ